MNESAGAHELFARRVAARPDATAVVCGSDRLSYGDLARLANGVAWLLASEGVGPGSLVAIRMERSVLLVAAILGVLETGAAYVPLDPEYPRARLRSMIADSRAHTLLVDHAEAAAELGFIGRTLVLGASAALSREGGRPLQVPLTGDETAYVVYTSGSSGSSKGVAISHASLRHYALAIAQPLGITARDVYLHTASFSFSSSVRQLVAPLAFGATVVVADRDERRDPDAFLALVRRERGTVVDLVPTFWRACLATLADMAPARRGELLDNDLRLVASASEPLVSDVPARWERLLGRPMSMINMFGQTETTGIVSTYPIPPESVEPPSRVPIGTPISGVSFRLLDERMRPVEDGEVGELYVGGPTVGKGYLGRPDLTAERFLADPHEPTERLYRTGDLARRRLDGVYEHLGRSDAQIKVSGHRVEPGEVEAVLRAHPVVRQSAVAARSDRDGNQRLVAYVAATGDVHALERELRDLCEAALPPYMVPDAFVVLDALPTTPTGKIDRNALPAPGAPERRAPRRPLTDVEQAVADVWCEVLDVGEVGPDDRFFELGGSSLLATRVVSRLRETFRTPLPARTAFEAVTVEALARALAANEPAAGQVERIAGLLARIRRMSADEASALLEARAVEVTDD